MSEPSATATSDTTLHTRRIDLHRRVAVIGPQTIVIRPSRATLLGPLFGFLLGAASFAAISFGLSVIPVPLLVLLLLIAVVTIPFAGISLVYALIGADVVIDATKQSATWKQGLTGLGIGTEELVPFWKITAITVEEAGAAPDASGRPVEEFAQWQIMLDKSSGRRLTIAGATAARPLAAEAYARAVEVARAVAGLTGAPLHLPEPEQPIEEPAAVAHRPPAPRRRRRKARGRR
jgi:hypothetical protein